MRPLKLKTKLALSYAALFVSLLGSAGVAVYALEAYRLGNAADDNLVDHLAGLWGYIEFGGDKAAIKFDAQNPYVAYFLHEATRYYQLYDAGSGQLLLESDDSALQQLALSPAGVLRIAADAGIDTQTHNKVPLRFRSAVLQANGHAYLLRVGVSVERDLTSLAELRNVLLLLLPITLAIAIPGAWWTAGITLRPLRNLEKEADEISFQHLGRRLPLRGTNDELDSLTETFNKVLGRLEISVRQMRNFADFMAHELRTPMTVLRGEVEVELMRPDLPEEWRVHLASHLEEFDKLSRLINRFLLIAKAETGGIRMNCERLNLTKSLASVPRELKPLSQSYGVQVILGGKADTSVLADREWLERADALC